MQDEFASDAQNDNIIIEKTVHVDTLLHNNTSIPCIPVFCGSDIKSQKFLNLQFFMDPLLQVLLACNPSQRGRQGAQLPTCQRELLHLGGQAV